MPLNRDSSLPAVIVLNGEHNNMMIKVVLDSFLRRSAENKTSIVAEGNTINECLRDIAKHYSDVKPMLYGPDEKLTTFNNVFVNGEIVYIKDFDKPFKEGDVLYIFHFTEGG
jgi:molybdopterin converting factor small subunit